MVFPTFNTALAGGTVLMLRKNEDTLSPRAQFADRIRLEGWGASACAMDQ